MELDPIRMCELLVGLPDVEVVRVGQPEPGALVVVIEPRESRPSCSRCGTPAWGSPMGNGPSRSGRSVNEIAVELGCDWHTINTAVMAYGGALLEADVDRIGVVHALSLDETLVVRRSERRVQEWSTQIVDARSGMLLDIVEGRDSTGHAQWLAARSVEWLDRVQWGVMHLSGPYRAVFDTMLPDASQVADPFHLIKLCNRRLDECRRRVQNETMGHRGPQTRPVV